MLPVLYIVLIASVEHILHSWHFIIILYYILYFHHGVLMLLMRPNKGSFSIFGHEKIVSRVLLLIVIFEILHFQLSEASIFYCNF